MRPKVVDAGHHSRELQRLTGLDVEENQARRLLNDLAAFGAHHDLGNEEPVDHRHRWLTQVYEPIIAMVPPSCAASWSRPSCSTRSSSTAGTSPSRRGKRSTPSMRPGPTSTACSRRGPRRCSPGTRTPPSCTSYPTTTRSSSRAPIRSDLPLGRGRNGGRRAVRSAAFLDLFLKSGQTPSMPATDDLQHMLRGAGLRVTRPRMAVLDAVHRHPHGDTESFIDAVRRESPRSPTRPSTTPPAP